MLKLQNKGSYRTTDSTKLNKIQTQKMADNSGVDRVTSTSGKVNVCNQYFFFVTILNDIVVGLTNCYCLPGNAIPVMVS